ncbi:outer membrane beta-barrel protein [Endozoicomonas arenosclerae]|uniref:outer membrane beta-barrel protein n=1 Tax=Endozoicomonas arenosclerae TaxID=1633495 RepID=UPI000780F824|nr:outer membrane beta-barrel protein [Endozoicomonas arenosclerae]
MKKQLSVLAIAMSVVSSINASENYNYSNLQLSGSIDYIEVLDKKVDAKTIGVKGQYEFDTVPVVLMAAATNGSVDDDELISGAEWNTASYMAGVSYAFSVTEQLDILPGIAIARVENELKNGSFKDEVKMTAYHASLDARYHLEGGLWLNAGVNRTSYNKDNVDSKTGYQVGAEYQVDDDWGFGINRSWTTDQGSTSLFVKIFF